MKSTTGIVGAFGIMLLASVPAWAADYSPPAYSNLCAVSGLNGKIYGEGGAFDQDSNGGNGEFQGVGSLSFPLGCMLGAQVDGGAGKFGDFSAVGVGGHLFMRDPTSHLIGVHATYENWDLDTLGDNVGVWRVGPEAELYLGNISLEGWAGFEDGEHTDARFFARLTAAYYVTENLRLSVGWKHSDDFNSGVIGGEWQLSGMPVSLIADAEFGDDNLSSVMGGVKFYFGSTDKSLIDRHRQDDPFDGLFDFLGAASNLVNPGGGGCEETLDGCCSDNDLVDGCCSNCD